MFNFIYFDKEEGKVLFFRISEEEYNLLMANGLLHWTSYGTFELTLKDGTSVRGILQPVEVNLIPEESSVAKAKIFNNLSDVEGKSVNGITHISEAREVVKGVRDLSGYSRAHTADVRTPNGEASSSVSVDGGKSYFSDTFKVGISKMLRRWKDRDGK